MTPLKRASFQLENINNQQSTQSLLIIIVCPEYDTKLHLTVRHLFCRTPTKKRKLKIRTTIIWYAFLPESNTSQFTAPVKIVTSKGDPHFPWYRWWPHCVENAVHVTHISPARFALMF